MPLLRAPAAEYVVFVAPTPIQIKFYQHVIGSDQVKNTIRDGRNGLILIDLLRKICNTPGLLLRNRDDVRLFGLRGSPACHGCTD